jgi:hypothetical protein
MSQKLLPPTPIRPKIHMFERDNRSEAPPSYRASESVSTSLDITQRLERKLARYNASGSIWKRWLFEIIGWAASAACVVSPNHSTSILMTTLTIDTQGTSIGLLLYS